MELRETGKAGAAAVLLWPDDGLDAAVFASVVRSLGKSCRVLVPVFAPEEMARLGGAFVMHGVEMLQ